VKPLQRNKEKSTFIVASSFFGMRAFWLQVGAVEKQIQAGS
jgi:hypothetical protein